MAFEDTLEGALQKWQQDQATHKPPPRKPTPNEMALLTTALSLPSPILGSIVGGTVARAEDRPMTGADVMGAVADTVNPARNGKNRLDMFKKVSQELYAKLLPQAREALRSNDTPTGVDYSGRKAFDYYHGTNTSLWPSGNDKLPLIMEEVLGQVKLKDPLGTVRTSRNDPGREVWRGQLRDVVDAPEYFAAEPRLQGYNTTALVQPTMQDRVTGSFNEPAGHIKLNASDRRALLEGIAHEGFGHAQQSLDNQPRGSDPGYIAGVLQNLENVGVVKKMSQVEREWFARNLYRMHTGEALAEATENRVHLTPRERMVTWPLTSVPGGVNQAEPGKFRNPNFMISRYTPGTYSEEELLQLLRAMDRLAQKSPHNTQNPVLTYNLQQAPFGGP